MLSFGEESLIRTGESAIELPYTNNGSPGANTCLFVKESSLFSLSNAKPLPKVGSNIKQEANRIETIEINEILNGNLSFSSPSVFLS